MRKSSLEIMLSDEMQEKLKIEAADAFDMHIMQAFGNDIPDFIRTVNEYKGKAAAACRETDPEFADLIMNHELQPREVIRLFNDYIANCYAERRGLTFKNAEVSENTDELSQ